MSKNQSTIQVRIDKKTKKDAMKTFDEMGIDLSSAVKLFLRNVVITQSMPFTPRTENGFTLEYEAMLIKEADEAVRNGKRYDSAEELHRDILGDAYPE